MGGAACCLVASSILSGSSPGIIHQTSLHDMSCLLSQAHGTQTQNIDRMQVATSITSPTFTTASTTAKTQPYPVQQRTANTSNRSLQLSSAHETDTQQDPRAPPLIS